MIRRLRKKHFCLWIALAVLLPAGIFSAWMLVPVPAAGILLQPGQAPAALPVLLKKTDRPGYQVGLRTDSRRREYQLEWNGSNALTVPAALVYRCRKATDSVDAGELLGRIEARGVYRFPLAKDSLSRIFYFALYDPLHHRVLDRLNFLP